MIHRENRFLLAMSLLTLATTLLLASTGLAGTVIPGSVAIEVSAFDPLDGTLIEGTQFAAPVDVTDGSFDWNGNYTGNGWELTDVAVSGNIDPFTNLVFGLINNTAGTVNFLMSVTVPIAPIAGATVHGGSTGLSVTDANASGSATAAALAGKSYYSGQIDGSTVLPLFTDPFSLTASAFPGDTAVASASLGLPATLPSGPAAATIGIVVEFSLTAGDSISSTNFFRIEPVPEPSSLLLASLALLGIAAYGRGRLQA